MWSAKPSKAGHECDPSQGPDAAVRQATDAVRHELHVVHQSAPISRLRYGVTKSYMRGNASRGLYAVSHLGLACGRPSLTRGSLGSGCGPTGSRCGVS